MLRRRPNAKRKRCADCTFFGVDGGTIVGALGGSDTCRFQSVMTSPTTRVTLRQRPPVREDASGDSARSGHEDSAHQRSWALSMKPDLSARSSEGIGARRRRFWSSDEKRRMVAESLKPGASVSKVAQRYGVNANLSVHLAASGGVPRRTAARSR